MLHSILLRPGRFQKLQPDLKVCKPVELVTQLLTVKPSATLEKSGPFFLTVLVKTAHEKNIYSWNKKNTTTADIDCCTGKSMGPRDYY